MNWKERLKDAFCGLAAAIIWGTFSAWLLIPVTILDYLTGE